MSVFRASSHALITGGSSGIGYAVAALCLSHNMRVTIVDNNPTTLSHAASTLKGDVTYIEADVSSAVAWEKLQRDAGRVDFLMLNAGVTATGTWGDASYFDKILSTNLHGVIHGLNTFVPSFQSRDPMVASTPPAAIVITGSKQGITNPPGNPAYNASKAAVRSLAEHLDWDLRGHAGVSVHMLVPGWTWTGMSGNVPGKEGGSGEKPAGAWTAEQVAEFMEQRMREGRFYIICPDNDVDEATDRKRMLWGVGDVVEGRPPLTRWRAEWKGEVEEWMRRSE